MFDSKGIIMTFKLITDSTADLDEEWANAHDVEILGLTIQLDGKTYETVGENRLTSEVLLESMKNGGKPTTSQVNVGQFEESFRHHAQNGDKVLYLAFSSVLSGTYQSSMIARDIVLEEFPQSTIEIVDTLAAAGGEGYLSILAAQASAIMGSLANIKPLLWIEPSGKLVPLAKVRGRKKALKEVVSQATQSLAHDTAVVAYANDIEGAEILKKSLLEHEDVDHVLIMPLGPVISAHVGPGTLAVFSIGKEAR